MSINRVVLMGRLVYEPELKTTSNGISVCSDVIAVDRGYTKPGEERQTDFIRIVAWRKTAEFISQYFKKGSMIALDGSIQTKEREKDGMKATETEVIIDNVSFCGPKADNSSAPHASSNPINIPFSDEEDELPF